MVLTAKDGTGSKKPVLWFDEEFDTATNRQKPANSSKRSATTRSPKEKLKIESSSRTKNIPKDRDNRFTLKFDALNSDDSSHDSIFHEEGSNMLRRGRSKSVGKRGLKNDSSSLSASARYRSRIFGRNKSEAKSISDQEDSDSSIESGYSYFDSDNSSIEQDYHDHLRVMKEAKKKEESERMRKEKKREQEEKRQRKKEEKLRKQTDKERKREEEKLKRKLKKKKQMREEILKTSEYLANHQDDDDVLGIGVPGLSKQNSRHFRSQEQKKVSEGSFLWDDDEPSLHLDVLKHGASRMTSKRHSIASQRRKSSGSNVLGRITRSLSPGKFRKRILARKQARRDNCDDDEESDDDEDSEDEKPVKSSLLFTIKDRLPTLGGSGHLRKYNSAREARSMDEYLEEVDCDEEEELSRTKAATIEKMYRSLERDGF